MDSKRWLYVSELTDEDYEEAGLGDQMYFEEFKIEVEENDNSDQSIASDIEENHIFEHDFEERIPHADEIRSNQISIPYPQPNQNSRRIKLKSGPAEKTKGKSEVETFNMIMSPEIADIIIQETNRKAIHYYKTKNSDKSTNKIEWKPVTISEFQSYIGILLFAGSCGLNDDSLEELWRIESYPIFRAAMGIKRYSLINRFIRFDNGETRSERIKIDKAAVIRHIWTTLNSNLQDCFVAGENVIMDDQLFLYKGKTPFTKYVPSDSGKCGIKVRWLIDAQTSYPLQGNIWTGPEDKNNNHQSIFANKNNIKTDVNINKLLKVYTTKRITNRWSNAFFYNILDVAALASFIIFMENNQGPKESTRIRKQFIQNLAKNLVMPEILIRSSNQYIIRHFGTRKGIECMLGRPVEIERKEVNVQPVDSEARDSTGRIIYKGKCKLCIRQRSTRQACSSCGIPVCAEHSVKTATCFNCKK